jgi:transposase
MSLHPTDRSAIPLDTAELGHKLLDAKDPYRLIGEQLSDLVTDQDFAALYSTLGGAALSPVILALITLFQLMEKLPDRSATAAARLRIDWKYALHVPLDWLGFHFTNLNHFRQRLLEHEAEYLVFDKLLQKLVALGLVRQRGKQRTDSMSVLGLLAKLSRLELVWETLRVAVKATQDHAPTWLEQNVPEAFLALYLVERHDYDLTALEIADALRQAGADGLWFIQQLTHAPQAVQDLTELQTLRTVWAQQFEWADDGTYHGPRTHLEGHGLIQSPHEPEARYREKRGKGWQGYVAQVTETAEAKGDPNFITDVALTDAQVSDVNALPAVQARLAERDLTPSEQYVDQAYVSGTRLAESAAQDIQLVGPIASDAGHPAQFTLSDFAIDLETPQATCPGGQTAAAWTTSTRPDGSHASTAHFGTVCAECPLRAQCTTATSGRTITIHEHHAHVVQRRAEMQTEAFWQAMQRRPPVEGTISQLARQGVRHARYRGQRKVNLQLIFTAVGVNLRRLLRVWATGLIPSWMVATSPAGAA